ncbi:hypothetical protein GH810_08435 [Acetobacterium paludosum]|uniref:Prenylated flavin chaperone LpdD-like domain-containing protein n=1 Tax=Acetobacterium paludosum TaxID=52693 RepID=A0A923KXH2_9FIRM|nr:hypothetical protein [Acetobacterium paludosum]MBC3888336.1 hypothetical protein [Acetobacterium paludosum]
MKLTVGSGPTALKYQITLAGADVLILVTGGAAHIGCTAVGDDGRLSVYTAIEHRDDSLAIPLARRVSETFHCVCTVCAGFHLDDIERADIGQVLVNGQEGIRQVIAMIEMAKTR